MDTILMDTREKIEKKTHILDYLYLNGIGIVRQKLDVGDWMNPDNPHLSIDTKTGGLLEVYSNVITDHDRFRRECVRAQEAGVQLIVLVEENRVKSLDEVPDWINPRIRMYELRELGMGKRGRMGLPLSPPVSSKRLHCIMRTMAERYGVTWAFCAKDKTGETICKLLGF